MPKLPFTVFLKTIAACNPLMIIGNTIDGLYQARHHYTLAVGEEAEKFREAWSAEGQALDSLRDKYWRKETLLDLMAYSREPREGWEQGDGNLNYGQLNADLEKTVDPDNYDVAERTLEEFAIFKGYLDEDEDEEEEDETEEDEEESEQV
jgi:hypothetical protein